MYIYTQGVIMNRQKILRTTKQQFIVDATNNLIAKIGIDKINMEAIATEANYTKRTLYSYFQSKDEIFLWVYTDDLTNRWNYQKSQLISANNGVNKLKVWCESLFKYCDSNRQSLMIQNYMDYRFVSLEKTSDFIIKKFENINNDLAEGLRTIFNNGVKDGSLCSELKIDLVISQFLYSYRAILSRAFSKSYSFVNFDESEYVTHYIEQFIKNVESKS